MRKKTGAVFILMAACCFAARSQEPAVHEGRQVDTIPFQYINNMIIVKVGIAGKERNFFFDTGAPTLISAALQQEINVDLRKSQTVTDASGKTTGMHQAVLPSLKIGSLNMTSVPVTVFDMEAMEQLECLHIEGFLGMDVFSRMVVQIDLQHQRLLVAAEAAPLAPAPRFARKMTVVKGQSLPLVEVAFGNVFVENALFDTGMSTGLYSIADQTYSYVQQTADLDKYIVARGYGATSMVASGTEAEREKVRLRLNEMTVGELTVKKPVVGKGGHTYSLLGVQLLQYGRVTLDFINQRFYFEPLGRKNTAPIEKTPGFDIRADKNIISVGVVWKNSFAEKQGLKTGYRILEYGSQKVADLTKEEMCKVLFYNRQGNRSGEKTTLRLKFVDDKEQVRTLTLPVVDITGLQ